MTYHVHQREYVGVDVVQIPVVQINHVRVGRDHHFHVELAELVAHALLILVGLGEYLLAGAVVRNVIVAVALEP